MLGWFPELRCASGSFVGATLPRRYRGNPGLALWESLRRQQLTMSGGKDGFVLTLLRPQTHDSAGNHGFGRGDIVRFCRESAEDGSPAQSDTDSICGGSV